MGLPLRCGAAMHGDDDGVRVCGAYVRVAVRMHGALAHSTAQAHIAHVKTYYTESNIFYSDHEGKILFTK